MPPLVDADCRAQCAGLGHYQPAGILNKYLLVGTNMCEKVCALARPGHTLLVVGGWSALGSLPVLKEPLHSKGDCEDDKDTCAEQYGLVAPMCGGGHMY